MRKHCRAAAALHKASPLEEIVRTLFPGTTGWVNHASTTPTALILGAGPPDAPTYLAARAETASAAGALVSAQIGELERVGRPESVEAGAGTDASLPPSRDGKSARRRQEHRALRHWRLVRHSGTESFMHREESKPNPAKPGKP